MGQVDWIELLSEPWPTSTLFVSDLSSIVSSEALVFAIEGETFLKPKNIVKDLGNVFDSRVVFQCISICIYLRTYLVPSFKFFMIGADMSFGELARAGARGVHSGICVTHVSPWRLNSLIWKWLCAWWLEKSLGR